MTVRSDVNPNGVQSKQRRASDDKREAFEQAISEVHGHLEPENMLRGEPRVVRAWLDIIKERTADDMVSLTTTHGLRPRDAVQTLVVGIALVGFKVGRRYEQLLAVSKATRPRAAQRKAD